MNTAGMIITALGGTGALAGLVTAITTYFKSKTAAEERKRETAAAHKRMAEDMAAMREDIATIKTTMQIAVDEAAAMRVDNDALRTKVLRLENKNERLIAALPLATAAKENKKD